MIAEPGTANFMLVDDDGKVFPKALEACGVDLNKTGDVQKVVDRLWRSEAERMRLAVRRAPDLGENFYVIESSPGRKDAVLEHFKRELAATVGEDAAGKLMAGLHPTGYFGWFGKYDIEFQVIESQSGPSIRYTCRYPANSKIVGGGNGTPDSSDIKAVFGADFKFSVH